jgi:Fic family protein
MRRLNNLYIHQHRNWPNFLWDSETLLPLLAKVRHKQGMLRGHMTSLGFALKKEAFLETMTTDVLKSSEIEGEMLNAEQVRSSVARHLGMDIAGLIASDRNVDGIVEMMLDATRNYDKPLNTSRLFSWHVSLFPEPQKGAYKITVGRWRNSKKGPMQVVSGPMGKERVHFEAPDASFLKSEMRLFFDWFNDADHIDPVLKAAIAHLWFVTVHPFDDGNGRIARAIADMQLTKADEDYQRFYSMSAQIRVERKSYYEILEKTQKGGMDITEWLVWFLNCLMEALKTTEGKFERVLQKTNFWDTHSNTSVNERQRLMINKLFDGFAGKLSSSKWAKITKCSPDTALRDIQDLLEKGLLEKEPGRGRNTSYALKK